MILVREILYIQTVNITIGRGEIVNVIISRSMLGYCTELNYKLTRGSTDIKPWIGFGLKVKEYNFCEIFH